MHKIENQTTYLLRRGTSHKVRMRGNAPDPTDNKYDTIPTVPHILMLIQPTGMNTDYIQISTSEL